MNIELFMLAMMNKQGLAGDTNPFAQDYTELGNFMTYNSYMNEETKSLWP